VELAKVAELTALDDPDTTLAGLTKSVSGR
jgi:hypothetical protein